jgi:hypothetical protein
MRVTPSRESSAASAVALAVLLLVPFWVRAQPPGADEAAPLVVHARASVPSEAQKIGEVRLATRGETTVVQTVIVTRVPSRVLAEIREKELRGWPEGSDGRADAEAYLAALEQADARLRAGRARLDPREPSIDRRARLVIEFHANAEAAGVTIATFESPEQALYEPAAIREEIARPEVGRAYVLRNQRLILADAFSRPEADVDHLGPLGPAAR